MATESKKIKTAFRNGKRQGYDLGYEAAFKDAYKDINDRLRSILNYRDRIKWSKPTPQFCHQCFTGLESDEKKK